ncbi:hypothetical protein G7Z17_g10239 [Cylindrodendrum hubeiense]|uniref:RING-type E3 ubiquitin transferase n=1 Tax=Cylindrodendrum hubeiense TaxID=595255 RepID=A0A9P5H1V0_9HYPO|nr:hypothetical protein G7Z17_g10239 [Cylindrodendrum hubeiense]
MAVHWDQQINFTSALLLHSCITLLLKELSNVVRFLIRFSGRRRDGHRVRSSFTLDGYTSVLSDDENGELSELYYTNTGLALLGVALALAVVLNLLMSDTVLNIIVCVTFGITWVVSMLSSKWRPVLPFLALRRAGRFVWSDTPFVNFFSLIYVATALGNSSNLRLMDYVILRGIAIAELVFMKTQIAASGVAGQQAMLRALMGSKKTLMGVSRFQAEPNGDGKEKDVLERKSIMPFSTLQRMSVMFFTTTPGYETGSVRGAEGPLMIPLPAVGKFVDEGLGWKIHRISEDVMLIADNLQPSPSNGAWKQFITAAHGVLLRRLGKVRVVYVIREEQEVGDQIERVWRSNINLVTGGCLRRGRSVGVPPTTKLGTHLEVGDEWSFTPVVSEPVAAPDRSSGVDYLPTPDVRTAIAESSRPPLAVPVRLASRAFRLAGLAVGLGLSALTAYQRRQAQMASQDTGRDGHLDATAGREVVFCHACSAEWYREEHGLTCPSCHGDITEIIEPDNDPRDLGHRSSASTSPELAPLRFADDDDSDPDEADITEHLGPHGFAFRRSVRDGPDHQHHNPAIDPVLERFFNMVQGFGPPRRIFSNIVQDLGPPEDGNRAAPENFAGGPVPGFARSLHDILNLLNPANAMAGDAVYSQEALDRIITGLMEANPQSNAAPPATEAALQNLPRKPVDKEMLGNDDKTECTICIDEMKEGETVIFLPCKHWFHEACVVLWLKEHNTCPICRTPIEKNDRSNNSNNNNGGDNPNAGQSSARPSLFPTPPGGFPGSSNWTYPPPPPGGSSGGPDGGQTRPSRLSRPPSQSQSRLNEALRTMILHGYNDATLTLQQALEQQVLRSTGLE